MRVIVLLYDDVFHNVSFHRLGFKDHVQGLTDGTFVWQIIACKNFCLHYAELTSVSSPFLGESLHSLFLHDKRRSFGTNIPCRLDFASFLTSNFQEA